MEEFKRVTEHLIEMLEELDEHFESITRNDSADVDIEARKNQYELEPRFSDPKTENEASDFLPDPIAKIKKTIAELKPADYGVCLICGEPIPSEEKGSEVKPRRCPSCGQILNHRF